MAVPAAALTRYTDCHAKYYAWELTRKRSGDDVDRLSQSLFDATVDLNPHQIDAAVFGLANPLEREAVSTTPLNKRSRS